VDIYSCDNTGPQRITFTGDGEWHVDFHCVTGGRIAYIEPSEGRIAYIEPSEGTANQVWTRLANGEYVLKSNGKCLTDPANSRRNGTQLRPQACRDTVNQRWSLP
jgi:hypothetical protein